ncbi:MAG: hypothetical protein R6W83_02290 [Cryobacterium sp.]
MSKCAETRALRADAHIYRSIGVSCLALYAPIFAVLYWLTIPPGTWPVILLAQVLLVAVTALVLVSAARSTIWVSDAGIARSGPLRRRVWHPVNTIERVVVVEVYRVDDTGTQPHLVVLGKNGHALLHMHARVYARDAMNTVIDEIGAPVDHMREPVTLADLNRRWPQLLVWFEWRPSRLLPARRPLNGAE